MTVVNQTYGFVFVHLPKNAGTSVVDALRQLNRYCDVEIGASNLGEAIRHPYFERYGIAKHSTATEIRDAIGPDWDRFISFGVVRDPLLRTASVFAFLKQWRGWTQMPIGIKHAEEFDACRSLDAFVRSSFFTTAGPDRLFEPQATWLTDGTGVLAVDRLIHIDRLEHGLVSILLECGVPRREVSNLTLSRLNTSGAGKLPALAGDAREIVLSRYSADVPLVALASATE